MLDSFQELLDAIDDFLIDRVAQPICDKVRKTTGWSKRIPIVGAIFFMTICLILMAFAFYKIGDFYRWIGGLLFLWALLLVGLALILIYEEVSEEKTPSIQDIMEQARLIGRHSRQTTLVMWIIIVAPGGLALFILPGIRDIGLNILLAAIAEFAIPYFVACTDLPPGKNLFAKMKAFLGTLRLRPVSAPT